MKKLLYVLPFLAICLLSFIFFKDFFLSYKLPIPSDTIIGLYHPYRDLYANNYPNGIPYKNFLITDPVRQQYPWRNLALDQIKKIELPVWNRYEMAGIPLLGNMQTAVFYPINILFLVLPFPVGWSILIMLQPILAGIFLYLYLKKQALSSISSFLGAIVFSFSGFMIAWLEWGTIGNVTLWLPLLLLSIDNLLDKKNKKLILWSLIYIIGITFSFFAGHLQIFFYSFLITVFYFLFRWFQYKKQKKILILFLVLNVICLVITSVQWFPLFQLIGQSARGIDQVDWTKEGWFIPWQHAIQFIVPDFFGNPTTLNYWGTWNYGEMIGYIGIIPILFASFALFFWKNTTVRFFIVVLIISIIFSFPTGISSFIYQFSLPFISTAQPTRLLFLIDFSLSILAAFGFYEFIKSPNKKFLITSFVYIALFGILFMIVFFGRSFFPQISEENFLVAKRNLIVPSIFLATGVVCGIIVIFFKTKKKIALLVALVLIGSAVLDLFRFGWKFTPFTDSNYLFPNTKIISFLQNQQKPFRIMTTDARIIPPNFPVMYKLESIDGYDPLYLQRYGELIAASERGEPNISAPFGFNRIITPHKYDSKIIDLLGAKYILSFSEIKDPSYKKVLQEGQTSVYENRNAFPRAMFVENVKKANSKQDAISLLFSDSINLKNTAVVEDQTGVIEDKLYEKGDIENFIINDNEVLFQTQTKNLGFLVLFETFYPTVHATIDGKEVPIYRTDYNFRGIEVPKGVHIIQFSTSLL